MNIFLTTISAINDETRLKILRFIDETSEVCVCDIESSFDMIQSRISRHLKILKDAGFLKVDRRGRWAYYSIKSPLDKFRQEILKEINYLDIQIPKLFTGCANEKKILILCTGNSCRSIIAEALINKHIDGVKAYSAGVKASLHVNKYAVQILEEEGAWDESYHSKVIDDVIDMDFDLIVTVCDNAKENCPMFPKKAKVIHMGFEDPDGKDFVEFQKTMNEIKSKLLPMIAGEIKCG